MVCGLVNVVRSSLEIPQDKVLVGGYFYPKHIPNVDLPGKERYVLVPTSKVGSQIDCDSIISLDQTDCSLDWISAHKAILPTGEIMPSVEQFMRHYRNVNDARTGNVPLYNASGDIVSERDLDIESKSLNYGCWTMLNAHFLKGSGFNGLDLAMLVAFEDGKPVYQRKPLEECVFEDCYVELDSLNEQGLPTRKSGVQELRRGENFYFWHPIKNCVARFRASSGRVGLFCGTDPTNSDSVLGVRRAKNL